MNDYFKDREQRINIAKNYAIIQSKRAIENVEILMNINNFSNQPTFHRFFSYHPLMPQIFIIKNPMEWLWKEEEHRTLFLKSRTELKLQQLISFQKKNDEINKIKTKNERNNTN